LATISSLNYKIVKKVIMRIKSLLIVLFLVAFNVLTAFADPTNPCDDPTIDPDDLPPGACDLPLDTWVYVLVIAAVIYGAYRMHQKQKAFTAL
jgi:hypothetical protein